MNEMKRIFDGVHGAGWIALGVGAVAVGGLLIYGSMPAEGQGAPVAQEQVAQGTLPLPTPGAAPATAPAAPAAPSEEERRARTEALAAKANIDVIDAWTRATAGTTTTAPIYLHIISAKDADRLVGAEVAAADDIELRENGQANASKAPMPVEIPAGTTVDFSPNSKHFMLTGLKAPLKEGDSFLITLKFDKAGTESAVVKILAPTATSLPVATGRPGDTTQAVSNP
jgi:copper(I)-binding protein